MKKIVIIAGALVALISCSGNKNPDKLMVGNDKKNGCIPSAGYEWSQLEKNCIRPFEEGVKLNPVNNSNYVAYVIKKDDKIELFAKENSSSILLEKQNKTTWTKGAWVVEFVNNKYTVKNNNTILYKN